MTPEELKLFDLPLSDATPETCLLAESALDWLQQHTILQFDASDPEMVRTLPAGARLFIVKFVELQANTGNITSESIGGLSQSFDTTNNGFLLWQIARDLLSGYLKSQVTFHPGQRRWQT